MEPEVLYIATCQINLINSLNIFIFFLIIKQKKGTHDTLHMTCDILHFTYDTGHLTYDI